MFAMFCWGLPFPDNVVKYDSTCNIKQSSQNQCTGNQYSFGNTRRKKVIHLGSFLITQLIDCIKIIDVYRCA